MATLLRHEPQVSVAPYIDTKRALISAEMLACSQVGFNVARGALADLQQRVAGRLMLLQPGAEQWLTPVLLRPDWLERGVWRNPPDGQWCREEPGGYVLTPRPLMHLLNRLRHHPVQRGTWRLQGSCVRHEQDTLPLYRQRGFTMVEYAWSGADDQVRDALMRVLTRLWQLALHFDLPVTLASAGGADAALPADAPDAMWHIPAAGLPLRLDLCLPELPPLNIATAEVIAPDVRAAYKLGALHVGSLGLGVERWCLALLARYGVDPERWPGLGSHT